MQKGRCMQLENKGVLVTGGASGLGAACVRLLSSVGAKVVIADMNSETGNALAQELGASTLFVKTNVVEEESVQAAVQAAVDKFGGVHVSINCAGIGVAQKGLGKNWAHSLAAFTRVSQFDLIGSFNTIRLGSRRMSTNKPR